MGTTFVLDPRVIDPSDRGFWKLVAIVSFGGRSFSSGADSWDTRQSGIICRTFIGEALLKHLVDGTLQVKVHSLQSVTSLSLGTDFMTILMVT